MWFGRRTSTEIATTETQLVTAAQKEGSLLWYTTAAQPAAVAQAEAFQKKYGVKVNIVRLAGAQLVQRFKAELAGGGPIPDVVTASNPAFNHEQVESGAFSDLAKAGIPGYPWDFPAKYMGEDVGTPLVLVRPQGIAYNTDKVKGDDIPKDWTDLLDPKWKGQIGIADPSASIGAVAFWQAVSGWYGQDYLPKLGAQNLKVYAAGTPAAASLGAGEISIWPGSLEENLESIKAKGAPVDFVIPARTNAGSLYIGLVTDAEKRGGHPNAARLFIKYAMSEEGAKILADKASSASPYDPRAQEWETQTLAQLDAAPGQLAETEKALGLK